jgi:uncharacterized repeat protein (TIGR01451 family)
MFFVQIMTTKVYADCQPIYGGGVSCQPSSITISKNVFNPATNSYVHDLGSNDPNFRPGDMVTFQISVTNTGSATIGSIHIVDTLPSLMTFAQGQGIFTAETNAITFTVTSLTPGQTQTFTFSTQILDVSKFPANQDTQCLTNQVIATVDSDGTTSQDNSQFCIFHPIIQTLGATSSVPAPSTGADIRTLLVLFPGGLAGLLMHKHLSKGGYIQ